MEVLVFLNHITIGEVKHVNLITESRPLEKSTRDCIHWGEREQHARKIE